MARILLQEDEKDERKVCRVFGQVKRRVIAATEVGWEDAEFAAGIYGVQ